MEEGPLAQEGKKAMWERPWGASTTTTAELDLNALPDDAGAAAPQPPSREPLRGDLGPSANKKVVYLFGVKVEYTDDETTITGGGCCDKEDDNEEEEPTTASEGQAKEGASATMSKGQEVNGAGRGKLFTRPHALVGDASYDAKGVDVDPAPPKRPRQRKTLRRLLRCRAPEGQRHWEDRYAQVKAYVAEHGGQLPSAQGSALRSWLYYWGGRGWRKLDPGQRDRLTALGIARSAFGSVDEGQDLSEEKELVSPSAQSLSSAKRKRRRKRQKREEEPVTTTTTTMTTTITTTATTATTDTTATTTMVPQSKPRKKYITWAARFEELRQYRELHGDRPLPDQHESPLGAWLHSQRYRINTGRMTNEDKIAKLTALGLALLPPSMIPELDI